MSDKERVAKQRELLQRGKADEQPAPPPTADEINAVAPRLPVKALATLVHLAESQIVAVTEAVASMEEGEVTEEQKRAIDAGSHLAGSLRQAIDEVGSFLQVYNQWWEVQEQLASPIIKPR